MGRRVAQARDRLPRHRSSLAPAESTRNPRRLCLHRACMHRRMVCDRKDDYYRAAMKLADAMIARFYDSHAGALFGRGLDAGRAKLGALTARRKPLQDSPTPAGNPTAAAALLRLEALAGARNIATSPKRRWAPSPASSSTSVSTRAGTAWRSSGSCSIRCRSSLSGRA